MKLKENVLSPAHPESAAIRSLIRGSQMGCTVVDCLSEETTEEAIIATLRALYDVPGKTVEAEVTRILASLRQLEALDG